MGIYENQYRALEKEGATVCEQINQTIKEIKASENDIKESTKKIENLQQQRQSAAAQHTQQPAAEGGANQSDARLKQMDKEMADTGEKITFMTGKISSLKVKQSENENKLNEIVNKLNELKSKVSAEKSNFNATYRGVKSKSEKISKQEDAEAVRYIEDSANKAYAMYQQRTTNEKEIDSIIKKLKGCVAKSANNTNYNSSYQINHSGGKRPDFSAIPDITAKINEKSQSGGKRNSGLEAVIEDMTSPEFQEQYCQVYLVNNKSFKHIQTDPREAWYRYQKQKELQKPFTYEPNETKNIVYNRYSGIDYDSK